MAHYHRTPADRTTARLQTAPLIISLLVAVGIVVFASLTLKAFVLDTLNEIEQYQPGITTPTQTPLR